MKLVTSHTVETYSPGSRAEGANAGLRVPRMLPTMAFQMVSVEPPGLSKG